MRTVASLVVVRLASVEVTPNRLTDVTLRLNTARTICIKIQALLHSYVKVTRSLSGGGGICPGGVTIQRGSLSLSRRVSISVQKGVSVHRGGLCPGGLCPGGGSV